MSDLRRCIIKSIISPGDYWMTKYYEGRSEVDDLQDRLSREIRYSKFTCTKGEIGTGEIVAVQHPKNRDLYLRGKVKKIFMKNAKYAYEVFLIDHGMHIDVDRNKIEIITNAHIRNKEPAAFKVHLFGVQPIQPSEIDILNLGGTGFKWQVSQIWVPSALGFVKRRLQEVDEIYLKCRKIVRNIVVADIYLSESIVGSMTSLADLLTDNKYAIKLEGFSLTSSKIAPSSSDGGLSVSASLPVDIIEIQEIQSKLDLVNKWRMEHVAVEHCASKSELDDTWDDENDLMVALPEEKVEEKKSRRSDKLKLLERLRNPKVKVSSTHTSDNSDSMSGNSVSPSNNSCSNVSSRSLELFKRFSEKRSKARSACSGSSGSDKVAEEDSKIKVVMNCDDDLQEDDEDGFKFEELMPIKPAVVETLEPVLINSFREETCSGLQNSFSVVPAGRNAPDLPRDIKKKIKSETPLSSNESPGHDDDPWIISNDLEVEPQLKFKNIPFAPEILNNLEKENFETLLPLQRWSIPSIRRGENVVMIAPSNCGKTLSYILPVMDSAIDEEVLEGCQVHGIIMASSAKNVRFIHSMCQSFLNKSTIDKVRILAVHEENVKYVKPSNCHILILTPDVFTNFMKNSAFDLQKLNFLVLDDADRIPDPIPIVESVLKTMGYKPMKEQCSMIVVSRHWTFEIYDIIEKVQKKFLYLISSNVELAVFYQIRCSVLYLSEKEPKPDILLSKIRKVIHKKKILIMCNDRTEIHDLIDYLKTVAVIPLLVHEGLNKKALSDSELAWRFSKQNSAPVLLCTFDKFNDIKVEDTDLLLYYSLPTSFKQFNDTLSCFKRNFKGSSHPKVQKEVVEESSFIILVDGINDTLPKIMDVAERLGAKIPKEILQNYDRMLNDDNHPESSKGDQDNSIMFCPRILETGNCPEKSSCPHRHVFSKDLDAVNLPASGEIVFKLISVDNLSCFWATLLEEEDSSTGGMKRVENKSWAINVQLVNFYKLEKNRKRVQSFKLGHLCGVKCDSGLFFRAQIYSERNFPEIVVRRLDRGDLRTVKANDLYELPPEASLYPPQIVQICLGNMSPISDKTDKKGVSFITDLMSSKSDNGNHVWSGSVIFSINNTIVLEEMKVLSIEGDEIDEIFIRNNFIEKNLAVENPRHLSKLYRLTEEAGISNETLKVKGVDLVNVTREQTDLGNSRKMKAQAAGGDCKKIEVRKAPPAAVESLEPEWATFEQPFTQAQFISAENTSLVFLRDAKCKKKLEKLEAECQKEGERIAKNSEHGSSLRKGDYCLAKAANKRKWKRARIENATPEGVDVFFLDHADPQYVHPKNVIPIPVHLLKSLPIQAVECSLIGIKHTNECPIEITNEIYDFSKGGKEELIVQKITDSLKPKISNGLKYDVNLISLKGKSLNKQLIDNGLVTPLKSEMCFVKDSDDILED